MRNRLSNELMLCHYSNGIKLMRPDRLTNYISGTEKNLGQLFDSKLLLYFFDFNNIISRLNKVTADFDGFSSEDSAIGKTMHHVCKKSQAKKIEINNNFIMYSRSKNIFEEYVSRKDDLDFHAVSLKFPLYDEKDRIKGVFGCSFVINPSTIVESLNQAIEYGFFNNHMLNKIPHLLNFKNKKVLLSKREKETLYLVCKGLSAKNIGLKLGLSHRTIEHNIERIRVKMHAVSKTDLIIKAFEYFDDKSKSHL